MPTLCFAMDTFAAVIKSLVQLQILLLCILSRPIQTYLYVRVPIYILNLCVFELNIYSLTHIYAYTRIHSYLPSFIHSNKHMIYVCVCAGQGQFATFVNIDTNPCIQVSWMIIVVIIVIVIPCNFQISSLVVWNIFADLKSSCCQ